MILNVMSGLQDEEKERKANIARAVLLPAPLFGAASFAGGVPLFESVAVAFQATREAMRYPGEMAYPDEML